MKTKTSAQCAFSSILFLAFFGTFCATPQATTVGIKKPIRSGLDTISKLADMRADSAIFEHNGKYSFVIKSKYVETVESDDVIKERSVDQTPDSYIGKDRAEAKTSIPDAEKIIFATTTELRASLISDAEMRSKKMGIGTQSPRTTIESQNVSVTKAYLFAISRESDNDLHLIIGNKNSNGQPIKLMNCEISGLPNKDAPSYPILKSVRDYIIGFLGSDFTGKPGPGYIVFTEGLPMAIEGPLFYDIGHAAGIIGPKSFRSPVAWEIHPISFIAFD